MQLEGARDRTAAKWPLFAGGGAAKGPLPEGIPGSNTGYWAGKSIG